MLLRIIYLIFTAIVIFLNYLALNGFRLDLDRQQSFYLGGIQINEPDDVAWVNTLKAVGMNTVSVTSYARQADWDSDALWFDKADTAVVQEIRAAKAEGLRVTLILRVLLDTKYEKNLFLWHGMIMPQTDEQVCAWFENYSEYARMWAGIADREGVDLLVVGSELNMLSATAPVDTLPALLDYYLSPEKQMAVRNELLAFSDSLQARHLWVRGRDNYERLSDYVDAEQAAHANWAQQVAFADSPNHVERINRRRRLLNELWLKLIKETRSIYSGKLSYAANFDNYREVDFWQALDFIGINAYFKLRNEFDLENTPGLSDSLKQGWQNVFQEIDDFRITKAMPDKRVIFTELGYTYRRNSTLEPWNGAGFSIIRDNENRHLLVWEDEPRDFTERALALRALFETHMKYEKKLLQGILYWKLSTKDYHLPYEPFMLHVAENSTDPLMQELVRFAH